MYYLTEDDYKAAQENGIGRTTAYRRFYEYGWSRDRTIQEPINPKQKYDYDKWKDHCEKYGVSIDTFRYRVKNGWTKRKAATTPPMTSKDRVQHVATFNRKYPKSITDLAKKNGIKMGTFYNRVNNRKMSPYDAATQPIDGAI